MPCAFLSVRRTMTVRLVLACLGLFLAASLALGAEGKNKQNKQGAAKPQAKQGDKRGSAAADKARDTAEKHFAQARQNLFKVQEDVKILAEHSRRARGEVQIATQARRDREASLEEGEPADSTFGTARDACRDAEKQLHDAENRVLESKAYREACEAAQSGGDSGSMARIRKNALDDDPGVQAARKKLDEARAAFEPMRQDLYAKDVLWKALDKDLDAKKREEDRMEREYRLKMAAEKPAVVELKLANEALAVAAAGARQAQAKDPPKHAKTKKKKHRKP